MAYAKEGAAIGTPIVHGLGNFTIGTGQFLASTGYILTSPYFLYKGTFLENWHSLHGDFNSFYQGWDKELQKVVPMSERDITYDYLRGGTELTAEALAIYYSGGKAAFRMGIGVWEGWQASKNLAKIKWFNTRFICENDKFVTLYRAVKPAELMDIQKTGIFHNLGDAEGKYFTTSIEGASSYARKAVTGFGDPPYTLIKTRVPITTFDQITPTMVDSGIPALIVPEQSLEGLIPEIMPWMVIPK